MSEVKVAAAPVEKNAVSGVVELTKPKENVSQSTGNSSFRLRFLPLSFLCCVLAPILLLSYYFLNVATDRFTASAGFAVRGIESSAPLDGIGVLTGLANSGSTSSDSYIILRFLESAEFLNELNETVGLKDEFSSKKIDVLSRLKPEASPEDFLKYWQRRIISHYDPTSGIIEFKVQSFSPEHAEEIASQALLQVQGLVNDLSLSARLDSVTYAEREIALQEERLREAFKNLREFRASQQKLNPVATAELGVELLGSLEARLVEINSRIAEQAQVLDSDAPSLLSLKRQASAIQEQIDIKREELTGIAGGSAELQNIGVPDQLTQYEELEIERRFAETSYSSALSSLEQARRDADRQQRYLAIFSHPQTAETAEFPRRIQSILVGAFAIFAAWSIATLLTYSVRDHLT